MNKSKKFNKSKKNNKSKKFNKTKKQKKIKGGNNYFYIIVVNDKEVIDNNERIFIYLHSSKTESKDRPIAHMFLRKMSKNTIKIDDFQVLNPDNRTKGYGSSLMKYTINFIKQNTSYNKIIGDLSRVDNIPKLSKFYSRFGFLFKEKNGEWSIVQFIKDLKNIEDIKFTDTNTLKLTDKEFNKYDDEHSEFNNLISSREQKPIAKIEQFSTKSPLLFIHTVMPPPEERRKERLKRFST